MREKAKTQARKVARTVKDEMQKLSVLLGGKEDNYPEQKLFSYIQNLAEAIEHKDYNGHFTEADIRVLYNAAVKEAGDSLATAIIGNDVGFFERMADLARLRMQTPRELVDEKAAQVTVAVVVLRKEKKKITGETVAEYLNKRFKKPERVGKIIKGDKTPTMNPVEWDGGEVRKIMRRIGICGH